MFCKIYLLSKMNRVPNHSPKSIVEFTMSSYSGWGPPRAGRVKLKQNVSVRTVHIPVFSVQWRPHPPYLTSSTDYTGAVGVLPGRPSCNDPGGEGGEG